MKLSEWEKNLLTEEVCLLCHSRFAVELMEQIGQVRILGSSGTFAFYDVTCPKGDCPFVMTVVLIRTQLAQSCFDPSLEAVAAIEVFLGISGLNCGTCGGAEMGDIVATIPHSEFPAFWIISYCHLCETKNSQVIWWRVVNPLDMVRNFPTRTAIKVDLVLDAHEALKKVSGVADLFR